MERGLAVDRRSVGSQAQRPLLEVRVVPPQHLRTDWLWDAPGVHDERTWLEACCRE